MCLTADGSRPAPKEPLAGSEVDEIRKYAQQVMMYKPLADKVIRLCDYHDLQCAKDGGNVSAG